MRIENGECSSGASRAVVVEDEPQVRWPVTTYLVSHRYGFLYCPIPKNACSSLKEWYLLTQGMDPGDPAWPSDVHVYCQEHALTDPADLERGYFKFVFVRNPWRRLVSGYVQKFIGDWNLPSSPARAVVEQIHGSRGLAPDYEKSITFREFVDYVEPRAERELDPHWKSQFRFLDNLSFDFIGRVENLAADFQSIVERLGIQERILFGANRTSYGKQVRECVADWPATASRALQSIPHYRYFYTDDLRERVARRYARDIEMFGYTFD